MFRITYGYYRIDENFEPIGDAIVKYVDGETVKQVNDAFHLSSSFRKIILEKFCENMLTIFNLYDSI